MTISQSFNYKKQNKNTNLYILDFRVFIIYLTSNTDGNEDTLTLEDLYVPADDDYLLGSTSPDRVIGGLVTNYIIGWTDSLGGDVGGKFPNIPTIPPIDELIYSYEYETIENISEMLITTWHQQSPFND